MESSVELIKTLPPRLLRFFTKYPPMIYSAQVLGSAIPANRKAPKDSIAPPPAPSELPPKPNALATGSEPPPTIATSSLSSTVPISSDSAPLEPSPETVTPPHLQPSLSPLVLNSRPKQPPNPFLPYRNPATGRWRGAHIGLRRQAEFVKLAVQHGVEPLLPPGIKSTEYKTIVMEEKGKRLKGTGVGEKVKGHKWERTLKGRLETRRQAMVKMPEMIREWKERGHGRGWKKYPR